MTNFLRAQIVQCAVAIESGTFDENTIRSLYMYLRESAKLRPDCLTAEIGDFFAHPERNRGMIKRYVEPVAKGLIAAANGRPYEFTIQETPHTDILDDLDQELSKLSLPPIARRSAVALALFAAFQGASIRLTDGAIVQLGFFVLPNGDGIHVCGSIGPTGTHTRGAAFPIFAMPNDFGIPEVMPDPFQPGWTLIRVPFVNGKLDLFQTNELIEGNMPKQIYAHPHIPYRTPIRLARTAASAPNNASPGSSDDDGEDTTER